MSSSTHQYRLNRVDVPSLLLLVQNNEPLRIYVHPEVPMYTHFMSQLNPACIARKPHEATHILLDLLPPHPQSSMRPNPEQRGFIEHRGRRKVLCGYWAQECLRVGGVAEIGFWDLSLWEGAFREELNGNTEIPDIERVQVDDRGREREVVDAWPITPPAQEQGPAPARGAQVLSGANRINQPGLNSNSDAKQSKSKSKKKKRRAAQPPSHWKSNVTITTPSTSATQIYKQNQTPPRPSSRSSRRDEMQLTGGNVDIDINADRSSSPPAARTRAKRPRTPTPPSSSDDSDSDSNSDGESSMGHQSHHDLTANSDAIQIDDDLHSLPDLSGHDRPLSDKSSAVASSSTSSSSMLVTPRPSLNQTDQVPRIRSQPASIQSLNDENDHSNLLNQEQSTPSGSQNSTGKGKGKGKRRQTPLIRRKQPKLDQRSQKEQDEIWRYFLASAYSQLDEPIPEDVQPGTVDAVEEYMEEKVKRMWIEGRTKYNRRNLDHLSIMLSTWTTSREYKLSPKALRAYYTKEKHAILQGKLPYASALTRPADWPFHENPAQDIEATAWWIWDWGTKQANAFLGRGEKEGAPTYISDPASNGNGGGEEDELEDGVKVEDGEEVEIEDDLVSYASD